MHSFSTKIEELDCVPEIVDQWNTNENSYFNKNIKGQKGVKVYLLEYESTDDPNIQRRVGEKYYFYLSLEDIEDFYNRLKREVVQ